MRELRRYARMGVLLVLLGLMTGAVSSTASGAAGQTDNDPQAVQPDDLEHPLGKQQRELRAKALEMVAKGKIKAGSKVAQVAKGQYVELSQEGNDRVFVIVADFGTLIHPSYGQAPGPLHNQIAQPPNDAVDNTTIWQADYNKAHYENMYFKKMVDYYKAQSSGRYTINGDVIDWVTVPYNEARYGQNTSCGSSVCSTVWYLIRDAINKWTADRIAAGETPAQIKTYLDTFDKQDRYDVDGDGNFDEKDGYIDHFQIVHAGEGEETGGGAQGAYAIWSHRWYTSYQGIGVWGPAAGPQGGMEFGGDGTFGNLGGPNAVGVWVGDYTMQPENGGLGVFAHEYAHDLGLPDQYDTSGGENSTGFWTIMSSGSYLGDGTTDLGSKPGDFNAWEKFQLGWLNYEVAFAGAKSEHKLGPAEFNTKQAQGLFVVLPDKQITANLATAPQGTKFYYSGSGDNIDTSMTRPVTLPAGTVSLTAKANFQIEFDWDYAYLTVNGTPVATNLSSVTNPNGQNFGQGITGSSGGNWVNLTANLSAFAGQTVTIGFRYWTDGAVVEPGFMVDDIQVNAVSIGNAETDADWTFNGFKTTTGTETSSHFNAYVVENRNYVEYDKGLETGPYNFGFLNTLPDWVEHFPYQDGILISYWDSSFTDNNTSQHPGGGLILPIDAHPNALVRPDSLKWRARVQTFDSTFGLQPTDALTLHINGVASPIPSLPGVSTFNDSLDVWDASTPLANVITPNTGTTVRIKSMNPGGFAQIQVAPAN